MRRRIVVLAMLAATLATSLFGVPLALSAARYYRVSAGNKVERAANKTAIDLAADMIHGRLVDQVPDLEPGTGVAIYTPDGRLVAGEGPSTADSVVHRTLRDKLVHRSAANGQMTAAVPITDGPRIVFVVRSAASTSALYLRILRTWALMLLLEAVVLAVTFQLARWQARRLARPLEHLAATARTLGDGDFSVRAQPSGIREIDAAGFSLNQTAERLDDLVERERAITANASHQLRTPLTGLRLGLEAALDSPHADHRQAIIDAVATTERLSDTIEDLIALARNTTRSTERVELQALLDELADTWGRRLAEAGRELRVSADAGLPPPLASTAAVRQILAVLIDNAVQHGVGAVTVHARDTSAATAIDVADEGTGLDQDQFDLLYRRSARGHGLGLALARDLAEAEGGRLRLSSRTPTTFTLFLPTAAADD
ncbi:sensor histidine kinase [Mycobacterium sp. pUA109]|uniref:sensor histidine kinase n=1 Tax=Mycobacterium sp. pUA109 TaxID=3238982 RepID=UPI00351B8AA3